MSTLNWHLVHQTDCKYFKTFKRHACEKTGICKKNKINKNNNKIIAQKCVQLCHKKVKTSG